MNADYFLFFFVFDCAVLLVHEVLLIYGTIISAFSDVVAALVVYVCGCVCIHAHCNEQKQTNQKQKTANVCTSRFWSYAFTLTMCCCMNMKVIFLHPTLKAAIRELCRELPIRVAMTQRLNSNHSDTAGVENRIRIFRRHIVWWESIFCSIHSRFMIIKIDSESIERTYSRIHSKDNWKPDGFFFHFKKLIRSTIRSHHVLIACFNAIWLHTAASIPMSNYHQPDACHTERWLITLTLIMWESIVLFTWNSASNICCWKHYFSPENFQLHSNWTKKTIWQEENEQENAHAGTHSRHTHSRWSRQTDIIIHIHSHGHWSCS